MDRIAKLSIVIGRICMKFSNISFDIFSLWNSKILRFFRDSRISESTLELSEKPWKSLKVVQSFAKLGILSSSRFLHRIKISPKFSRLTCGISKVKDLSLGNISRKFSFLIASLKLMPPTLKVKMAEIKIEANTETALKINELLLTELKPVSQNHWHCPYRHFSLKKSP